MTLWQRFQRLTLWNKIAVAGSLASFVGLVLAVLTFLPSPDKTSTPITYQTQHGDGGVNVQAGQQSGHITVIQTKDSAQEPNTALQLIELANVDGHTLDFKLKNSGSDSAFLTGIRFVFKPAIVSNTGCNPVPATYYHFLLQGESQAQTVTILPSFKKQGVLYLKVNLNAKIEDLSWSVVPLNLEEEEAFSKADKRIKQGQGIVSFPGWPKLNDDAALEEIFRKFPAEQYQPAKDEVVVYFTRNLDFLGTSFLIVRVVTQASQRLPLSQVVPPRGVDRFQVVFSLSDNFFHVCAEFFDFNGYGILEYDNGQELGTPPFTLTFASPKWRK